MFYCKRIIIIFILAFATLFLGKPLFAAEPTPSSTKSIHILPALSSPSIKNGQELKITALVKSDYPISKVTATISDISETLTLSKSSGTDTAGIWEIKWKGHDLQEREYTITLTATDIQGSTDSDTSLHFSDPTFGITTSGSTTYPNGGMNALGSLTLQSGEDNVRAAVIDTTNGFAYFGTYTDPGIIVKVRLSDFTRVGIITMPSGEGNFVSAVLDSANSIAYFGCDVGSENADRVVKINLSNFTRVGSLLLSSGPINKQYTLNSMALDSTNHLLYVTAGFQPSITRINTNTFTETGFLDLSGIMVGGNATGWDISAGFAYVTDHSFPGEVQKVDLTTMATSGSLLTFDSGENDVTAAVIDTTNHIGYFSTFGPVVKVDLNSMTRLSAINLSNGANGAFAGFYDVPNNQVIFVAAVDATHNGVYKIDIGSFSETGALSYDDTTVNYASVYDPTNRILYAPTSDSPSIIYRFSVSPQGVIFATKATLSETASSIDSLSFYSHTNAGHVRLALYDSSRNLLWQSGSVANTTNGGFQTVTITSGTPTSLSNISAGTYYLAYQTDTSSNVASFTSGSSGDGFIAVHAYGSFPAAITGETSSSQKWSMYVTYSTGGGGSPTPTPIPTSVPSSDTVASNSTGSSTGISTCSWIKPTGTPILFQVDAQSTSATVYFTPSGNPYTGYFIRYGFSPDDARYGVEYELSNFPGVTSYTLNLLHPSLTYYITVRANNHCMPGDWGNTMKITTAKKGSTTVLKYYKALQAPPKL